MRKLTQVVLCMAALMATPAFAEMKIAVMNYQMALLESDAAKKYAVDAEKKFGPQLNKLKQLEADAKRIQDRLVKDAEKMQQAERERLELEFKQKARDFQFQSKELNEAKAISDRDMLKQLKPKLSPWLGTPSYARQSVALSLPKRATPVTWRCQANRFVSSKTRQRFGSKPRFPKR